MVIESQSDSGNYSELPIENNPTLKNSSLKENNSSSKQTYHGPSDEIVPDSGSFDAVPAGNNSNNSKYSNNNNNNNKININKNDNGYKTLLLDNNLNKNESAFLGNPKININDSTSNFMNPAINNNTNLNQNNFINSNNLPNNNGVHNKNQTDFIKSDDIDIKINMNEMKKGDNDSGNTLRNKVIQNMKKGYIPLVIRIKGYKPDLYYSGKNAKIYDIIKDYCKSINALNKLNISFYYKNILIDLNKTIDELHLKPLGIISDEKN